MGFVHAIKTCFTKYVTFSGRAPRSEYWYWVLFTFVVGNLLNFGVDPQLIKSHQTAISLAFIAIFYIPGISVTVRRLHDVNRRGWLLLTAPLVALGIGVVVFLTFRLMGMDSHAIGVMTTAIPIGLWLSVFVILCIRKGTDGDNRFGPDPLTGDFSN